MGSRSPPSLDHLDPVAKDHAAVFLSPRDSRLGPADSPVQLPSDCDIFQYLTGGDQGFVLGVFETWENHERGMQWVIVCIFGCVIRILSNLCLPPAVQHPAHGPVSLRVTLLAPPAGKRHDDGNLWIQHEN
ncbi:predicted protein [Histoplasma capsulatum H143]|nr:predicted protein [Histoplasma capsulatum H143]